MKKDSNLPIYVTRPFLPPLEEFKAYLKEIWDSRWLTNDGKFHQELEEKLCEYLGVKYISLFSNGTLALITALQALKIAGEVITTPYSFVASTHALWWNKIKAVFVDIEPDYLTIDPTKIESAITPQTTAILAVHVYGNPCRVEEIQRIADLYGLKVIYDACHAFGVTQKNDSILNFGDLSVLSFHATKIYTTFEGGAIVSHDKKIKERIDYLKNFGFADELTVVTPGINGKMNEFQAALGIIQLKYIERLIAKSKEIADFYRQNLSEVRGINMLKAMEKTKHNYSFFPIFIDEKKFGKSRDQVYNFLKNKGIHARRYFYPLISDFPAYKFLESANHKNLSIAYNAALKVLCIPIYPDLNLKMCQEIVDKIKEFQVD